MYPTIQIQLPLVNTFPVFLFQKQEKATIDLTTMNN